MIKMPFSAKSTRALFFLLTLSLFVIYTTVRLRDPPTASAATLHKDTIYYRNKFLSTASNFTIAAYLRHLTLHPHLAGTPLSLSTALYVQSHFQSLGLTTHMTNFSVLLSYPTHSSLSARFSNGSSMPIPLFEPNVPKNDVVVPYHAYSPSGSAYGKAVFLNYGQEEDYHVLDSLGVDVKGCVGLVRRGSGLSRYDVAANAVAHGVSAVLLYTEGDWKEGFERGTVMKDLGDPLTPGWPGSEDGEKLDPNDPRVTEKFPRVPSLPISEAAAVNIIESLEGTRLPNGWRKGSATRFRWVGSGPTMLNFMYKGERKMATIHNVFAVIKGLEEPDHYVLLGNHRDAWTYGAVDPNSGTAVLLDVARRFTHLMGLGWKPRRTIILCSWDAEEFGMIGSTEWVEQNIINLGSKAVAYFNVDCAVQGPGFFVSATPQLDDLLVEVTKMVKDPDSKNSNLYDQWTAANKGVHKIERLSRVDSDFAPFLHHAGVPSIDMYFGSDFPVYHTAFDSYDWMVNVGDPSFQRHVTVAGIWGLVALHLASDLVLPFNYLSYATELQEYKNFLKTLLDKTISLRPLAFAIQEFATAAHKIEEEAKKLRMDLSLDEFTVLRRRILNDRLMLAERGFLDSDGLPGRQWFKHLVYGASSDGGSEMAFFPGIDAVMHRKGGEEVKRAAIIHEMWRVARAIQRAACVLRGEFTCG